MYAKLFADIVLSSLNEEPLSVRAVFMLMLSQADKTGFVQGTESTLQRVLNVTKEDWDFSIGRLTSPDPNSKSHIEDGRRLMRVEQPPGFQVVNYVNYRNIKDEKGRREYFRNYMRGYRGPNGHVNNVNSINNVNNVNNSASVSVSASVPEKEQALCQLPAQYNTPEVRAAWEQWLQYRQEIRKRVTPTASQQHIRLLQKWGSARWIAAIEQSIGNGWQGLFEPKMAAAPKRYTPNI